MSKLILNHEGLALLHETVETVRTAVQQINKFKQFLKSQGYAQVDIFPEQLPNTLTESETNFHFTQHSSDAGQISNGLFDSSNIKGNIGQVDGIRNVTLNSDKPEITVEEEVSPNNFNRTSTPAFHQTLTDHNLEVFITIPDNSVMESHVREVLEKEGFEDFVVTIKNKTNHSFGFIKFSNEEAVSRAVEMNFKLSINGSLMKIRRHKSNYKKNVSSEETPNVPQEIEESVLINISSGYQSRRIVTSNLENVSDKQGYEHEKSTQSDLEKLYEEDSEPKPLEKIDFQCNFNACRNQSDSTFSLERKYPRLNENHNENYEVQQNVTHNPNNSSKKRKFERCKVSKKHNKFNKKFERKQNKNNFRTPKKPRQ